MERYEKLEMEVIRFDVEDGMEVDLAAQSANTVTGCNSPNAVGTTTRIS